MAKKQFKAESKRLLDLMINSIYTHQEIFLREIISNASDAIDKLAYQALTDEKVGLSRSDFAIELKPDEAARTLTVSDNGVGIPKEKLTTIFNGGLSSVSHNNFDMKKNMGIGLSVCYTIVKAHDGTMTAENLDSGGACFRFYLPLEEGINSEIEG